jgi:hypothetical protein
MESITFLSHLDGGEPPVQARFQINDLCMTSADLNRSHLICHRVRLPKRGPIDCSGLGITDTDCPFGSVAKFLKKTKKIAVEFSLCSQGIELLDGGLVLFGLLFHLTLVDHMNYFNSAQSNPSTPE